MIRFWTSDHVFTVSFYYLFSGLELICWWSSWFDGEGLQRYPDPSPISRNGNDLHRSQSQVSRKTNNKVLRRNFLLLIFPLPFLSEENLIIEKTVTINRFKQLPLYCRQIYWSDVSKINNENRPKFLKLERI